MRPGYRKDQVMMRSLGFSVVLPILLRREKL